MEITVNKKIGKKNVTILAFHGRLDSSNYQELVFTAEELIKDGTQNLLLDMGGCDFMSSAGLMALHSISLVARGRKPLLLEEGQATLPPSERDESDCVMACLKLASLHPQIERTLEQTGMLDLFEVFPDTESAIASF